MLPAATEQTVTLTKTSLVQLGQLQTVLERRYAEQGLFAHNPTMRSWIIAKALAWYVADAKGDAKEIDAAFKQIVMKAA